MCGAPKHHKSKAAVMGWLIGFGFVAVWGSLGCRAAINPKLGILPAELTDPCGHGPVGFARDDVAVAETENDKPVLGIEGIGTTLFAVEVERLVLGGRPVFSFAIELDNDGRVIDSEVHSVGASAHGEGGLRGDAKVIVRSALCVEDCFQGRVETKGRGGQGNHVFDAVELFDP